MFLFELLLDLLMDCWFSLMQWIVPDRALGKTARRVLKLLVGAFSCVLLFSMIIGIFALISASVSQDPFVRKLGMYFVFVPLVISAVQILLGILVRLFAKK